MIPDKIIPAITAQTMSKTSERMHKPADNPAREKTLCPFHPGVVKAIRHKIVATLIIVRINMSIIRSLAGRIFAKEVWKVREMMTAIVL